MSHSSASTATSTAQEAFESLANSPRSRGTGKGLGPRAGTIKAPGSNLLPRRLKGKLVIVSSQRNTFQSQWLRREVAEKKMH